MSIVLQGSTSGSVTLQEPAIAGSTTINLPATSGTVALVSQIQGPAFSAYGSTTQSITNATWTKVTLNNEEFDTANAFDSTTNYRFTPQVAGYYQISGCLNFAAATSFPNNTIVAIYKNGSQFKIASVYVSSGATSNNLTVSSVIYFNGSTDYVELYGFLSGATNGQFANSQTGTYLSGSLVRAA